MSTYRTLKGYSIKSVTSDPANIKEGQIWYNDTSNQIKVAPLISAWASGGAVNTGRRSGAGAGTQTAGLAFGGYSTDLSTLSEEYNGSSWSEGNNLGTAGYAFSGTGTQTAGLCAGRFTSGFPNASEEYDGTSWSEGNNLNTARDNLSGLELKQRQLCLEAV